MLQFNAPLRPRTPDEDTPKELANRYNKRDVVELLEWAAVNYPKPRTTTAEWLHKATDRSVSTTLICRRILADYARAECTQIVRVEWIGLYYWLPIQITCMHNLLRYK